MPKLQNFDFDGWCYFLCKIIICNKPKKKKIINSVKKKMLHSKINKMFLLILYFVCPRFACRTMKNPNDMGLRGHPEWRGITCSNIGALEMYFSDKRTKMPLVNLGFDRKSNEVKILIKQQFLWFFTKPEFLGDFWPLWPSLT